jgi:uncharacterized membrane protein
MSDQGTEFLNRHFRALMKEESIELYNTYNETKASIVERLIRTLKTKMSAIGKSDCIQFLIPTLGILCGMLLTIYTFITTTVPEIMARDFS